jgi:hypothetical protein
MKSGLSHLQKEDIDQAKEFRELLEEYIISRN